MSRCIHGVYTKEECYQCAPSPERPTTEEGEEYPPRSQWTDKELEVCGPQTITEMYQVACTPEQYSLVFRNIAHRGGWKDVLSAQFDQLWNECAWWVSSTADRRRDYHNAYIQRRNVERSELQAQLAAAQEEVRKLKELNQHRIGQGVELASPREENDRLKVYEEMVEETSLAVVKEREETNRLRELVKVAERALVFVGCLEFRRGRHPCVASGESKCVACAALVRLRSGKDGGKKDA